MTLTHALSAQRVLIRPLVDDARTLTERLLDTEHGDTERGSTDLRTRARDAVQLRSRTGVFGIGRGLAVPHGYVAGWGRTDIAVAVLDEPLDFDAVDGRTCDVVLLIVSDPLLPELHNETLAELAQALNAPGRLDALRAADTPEQALLALTGDPVPATPVA